MKKIIFAPWNALDKTDYLYQNWYAPLKKLSKEIIIFDPRDFYFKYGKEKMNSKFVYLIEKEKPDMIFLTMIYDEFYFDTFRKIKEISPKTKIVNFFSDDEWRFDSYSKYFSPFIDVCLTSFPEAYEKSLSLGLKNFYLMPYSCNTEVFFKLKEDKFYDVSFIGRPTDERAESIRFLINNGVKISIWGKGWDTFKGGKDFNGYYKGIAEDANLIYNQSKIVLTFLQDDLNKPIQIKGRITEVAGSGAFQLITKNPYTRLILNEKETDYFESYSDLLKKVKYYLKNEKEREKKAGLSYEKVISKFTWDKSFKEFFRHLRKFNPVKSNHSSLFIAKNLKLGKIKEKFIAFQLDKNIEFSSDIKSLLFVAEISSPDIIITDFLYKRKELGEISCVRIHELSNKEFINTLKKESLIFSRDFFNKNKKAIIEFFLGKGSLPDLSSAKIEKIALPVISGAGKIPSPIKYQIAILKKYEISLFNLYYRKKYIPLGLYFIRVFLSSFFDGNLFILSSAREYALGFKKAREIE